MRSSRGGPQEEIDEPKVDKLLNPDREAVAATFYRTKTVAMGSNEQMAGNNGKQKVQEELGRKI